MRDASAALVLIVITIYDKDREKAARSKDVILNWTEMTGFVHVRQIQQGLGSRVAVHRRLSSKSRIVVMQKIAAIDAGSNALRMTIANVDQAGKVEPIQNIRLPVRLGQDVFATGALREETMRRAAEAFRQFAGAAREREVGQIRAIATSAMREAANRDILLDRISGSSGIEVEVISAADEARLVHLAVSGAINLKGKRALLVDIGGGSVEVTLSVDRNIVSAESYRMGAVRLLQELDGGREPAASLFAQARPLTSLVRQYAESARLRIRHQIGSGHVNLCAVTGGTAEDLGRLAQKLFKKTDDRAISLGELQALIQLLEGMNVKQRMRKLDLRPDRADVILPAAVILQLIAREARVRRVMIPHVGLKDGVLMDMAARIKKGPQPPRRGQVLASAARLGRKYAFDPRHAALTARLATQFFDQCRELHNLGDADRLLLETAAWLHDIGHFIDARGHDQHGYYILKSTPLIGLNALQQDVVAHLVRYHRSGLPAGREAAFRQLPQKERVAVTKLVVLLRLADALDASHMGQARSVELVKKKRKWELRLHGRGDLALERWELEKRRGLFEEVFGVELEVRGNRK